MIVVAQSTSIEDAQDLLDAGSSPWQALLLQNLLTDQRGGGVMGRHGASWGVTSCREAPTWYFVWFHCVSFKNSIVCESTFVCFRMFGELALRLRLRFFSRLFATWPAVCNMAGCWQHAMPWRFLSLRSLRSPESLHLTLPPGDPIASLVAMNVPLIYVFTGVGNCPILGILDIT